MDELAAEGAGEDGLGEVVRVRLGLDAAGFDWISQRKQRFENRGRFE